MRAGDLAPDHPDVGAPNLALGPVDESDLLAEVEGSGLGVINALNLDQTISLIRFHSQICVCAGDSYLVLGLVLCLLRW